MLGQVQIQEKGKCHWRSRKYGKAQETCYGTEIVVSSKSGSLKVLRS